MYEDKPARSAIGSLAPEDPQSVEAEHAEQFAPPKAELLPESATAPADLATLGALDPLAFVSSIKTMVDLGTKVLGLVAKFPGPQQATAQEVLKVLTTIDGFLSRLSL